MSDQNIPRTAALTVIGCFGLLVLFGGTIALSMWSVLAALAFAAAVLLGGGRLWPRDRAKVDAAKAARLELEATERRKVLAAREAREATEMAAQEKAEAARVARLVALFGAVAAAHIDAGEYWQGATFEMIEASLGQPEDVKESVYKSKTKTVYLYQQLSPQRYGLKVFFENGIVVGWEN